MCQKCGCNTCETDGTALMLNESKAPRTILSEGLKHHIDANKPLTDNFYTAGSRDYFDLIAEARSLYSRGILEFTNKRDIELLTETDQGHFGVYKGKKVPLDFPMLNEKGGDTAWEDDEGNKITLQDILDMTKNVPQKDYPTEKLAKIVLNWDDNPEEVERIEQVEISKQYPILIMVDEGGKIKWILDGNHRAQKALRAKSKTIPAKLIKPSNLDDKAKKVLLGLPMLNEIEIGDRVKIDKAYGGGKGEVKDKKGSFIVVNGKSYHESDVKLINEAELQYPDFDLNKNIKYQDTSISSGMWRYTGTEQGGKGVYRNLNNDQILGFDRSDFDVFRKNLSSHFDFILDELNEVTRYSGFNRNPEDPDSIPFEPTGSVSEFKEELTSLFGKFKGDLRNPEFIKGVAQIMVNWKSLLRSQLEEAKFKGKTVDLNKPTRGDSKKFKVYVNSGKKNADGSIKVKKVNFGHGGTTAKKAGQKTMSIRKSNPKARSAFRARHNCSSPGPKTMARYWSCKKW